MAILIAVIGASKASRREAECAEEIGRLIAGRGAVLVCGGLGGVMEAACRGAKQAGGVTIGVLPVYDRSAANPHVDYAIATGLGHARNVIVASSADAVIAVGGAAGTLSEIAFAMNGGITVVALDGWKLDETRIPEGAYLVADSPDDAVRKAFESIK